MLPTFRDDKANHIGSGTVIEFTNKYLIVTPYPKAVQLMKLPQCVLTGKVVSTPDTTNISRKEFDELIDNIPGNTTMSDWSFSRLKI